MSRTEHCKSNYVFCPFFGTVKGLRITCEGHVKGARIILLFDSIERMDEYMERYCNDKNCSACKLYRIINTKYNDSPAL